MKGLFFSACLFLCACTTINNYQNSVESWIGAGKEDLLQAWGYPDQIMKSAHNGKIYIYQRDRTWVSSLNSQKNVPYQFVPVAVNNPNVPADQDLHDYHLRCTIQFHITQRDIVDRINIFGNDCRATQDVVYRAASPQTKRLLQKNSVNTLFP